MNVCKVKVNPIKKMDLLKKQKYINLSQKSPDKEPRRRLDFKQLVCEYFFLTWHKAIEVPHLPFAISSILHTVSFMIFILCCVICSVELDKENISGRNLGWPNGIRN